MALHAVWAEALLANVPSVSNFAFAGNAGDRNGRSSVFQGRREPVPSFPHAPYRLAHTPTVVQCSSHGHMPNTLHKRRRAGPSCPRMFCRMSGYRRSGVQEWPVRP